MFSRVSGMKEAPAALCLPASLRRLTEWHLWEMFFFLTRNFPGVCDLAQSHTSQLRLHCGHQTRMLRRKRPAALKRSVKLAQIFKFDASTESKYGFLGGGTIMTEETVSEIPLKRAVNSLWIHDTLVCRCCERSQLSKVLRWNDPLLGASWRLMLSVSIRSLVMKNCQESELLSGPVISCNILIHQTPTWQYNKPHNWLSRTN